MPFILNNFTTHGLKLHNLKVKVTKLPRISSPNFQHLQHFCNVWNDSL